MERDASRPVDPRDPISEGGDRTKILIGLGMIASILPRDLKADALFQIANSVTPGTNVTDVEKLSPELVALAKAAYEYDMAVAKATAK